MKDFKVAGFPLPLYVLILALTAACMFTGCVPKSLVPAFLVLMVFGEGLNAIGNNVPVVKTYLGGSVICILGSAILTAGGLTPSRRLRHSIILSMTWLPDLLYRGADLRQSL